MIDKVESLLADKKIDAAYQLIKEIANVSLPGTNGNSVFCMAAQHGLVDIMKYLVEVKGISPDEPRPGKITPLMDAVIHNKYDAIQYLITQKVNLNAVDDDGNTALSWAIQESTKEVVGILLENGANAKYIHPNEGSMDELAQNSGRSNIVPLINKYQVP